MAKQQPNARYLVHTPAELASNHAADYQRRQSDAGVKFGVPAVDARVIPMHPGDMTCILARPGHGKTTLLARAARQEAEEIRKRGTQASECVVYVTWETSAEELVSLFYAAEGDMSATDLAWGRVPVDNVLRKAAKQASVPIWVIGHGIANAGKVMPRMTPDVVFAAIESMAEDFGVKPRLLLFDYMQLIPVTGTTSRVEQVTEAAIRVKELALRIGAPAMVGVQARREVDTRDDKTPEMHDAQWASGIEQVADKVFGVWRPYVTDNEKGILMVKHEGRDKGLKITPNLAILKLRKQRGDVGQYTWYLHFEPQALRLAEMELTQAVH